ncbi:response regulator transcription factor [Vagococcus carniphilus]|uniref:response regulator transcription factor n=1 Tax=Vagococcus carniphilus TaxID=218144 RepID=UPI002892209B|nr:response regulator transcription factor [Vagococcus carniphilus]MDT2829902.1 response regulator transcription factor [Vagococcus carniphilus]MDT2838336.1 response regulator transcription factor [Vagococcus carniphilus]MDT2854332.1 response regulator transcription factor [Vagococcus carniphilus]
MNRVLIVDDDKKILEFMTIALENEHFEVYSAENGLEALNILEKTLVDLAIVDVMMPEMDGFELTEKIKGFLDIPVLFLTARGELSDKIKGFNLGADDYIVKPFLIEELILRIQTLLKRYRINQQLNISVGKLTLLTEEQLVKVNQHYLDLAPKEFQVLLYLANRKEKVVTREELITKLWGYDYEGDERTVDVHIKRVREKLLSVMSQVEIKTVRGVGYRLEEVL